MFIQSNIIPILTDASSKHSKAFEAAGQAVAELFTAGCIGSACVQQGYLDNVMVRSLSKTCFTILLPMFLGTSIMNTIHKYGFKMSSLFVPLIAVTHVLLLYTTAKIVILPLFGIDDNTIQGRATNVCCAFGNAGVLPLIFVEALFRNSNILPRASSIVSMYLVGWSPLFWSFGRKVLLGETGNNQTAPLHNEQERQSSLRNKMVGLKPFFPPPVIGVTIGFLLAFSPVLRCLFMRCQSDRKAPLEVVFHSCSNMGRAANPLALLVLTSSLAMGVSSKTDTTVKKNAAIHDNGNSNDIPFIHQWFCVSMSRFVISPLLMFIMLKIAHALKLIAPITDGTDAFLQWFILLLEATMPSAQNSVLMLQVAEKRSEASRLARFLFSIYGTAMLPLIVVSTMLLSQLPAS